MCIRDRLVAATEFLEAVRKAISLCSCVRLHYYPELKEPIHGTVFDPLVFTEVPHLRYVLIVELNILTELASVSALLYTVSILLQEAIQMTPTVDLEERCSGFERIACVLGSAFLQNVVERGVTMDRLKGKLFARNFVVGEVRLNELDAQLSTKDPRGGLRKLVEPEFVRSLLKDVGKAPVILKKVVLNAE
eukprot:TRINITY_DN6660_c0_g1_i3.p1 TRINITY_DN6660_c0_g1~~TRINITY_DN6660_c0_g1_i3.p1  ORF type:complete len:210 (-),score=49.73 TRINITY_DN6660_c0_g1_i3:4-576(-)